MRNENNIIIATILSATILFAWHWFYEKPKLEQESVEIAIQQQIAEENLAKNRQNSTANADSKDLAPQQQNVDGKLVNEIQQNNNGKINRKLAIAQSENQRITIDNPNISGSINLIGAKFDDIVLKKHFQSLEDKEKSNSNNGNNLAENLVNMFSPANTYDKYLADFGWINLDRQEIEMPNPYTKWQSTNSRLTNKNPVILSWTNQQKIEFIIKISIDEQYLISIEQQVNNKSGSPIILANYGRITRNMPNIVQGTYILHEGPIAGVDGIIKEFTYEKIAKNKKENFEAKNNLWIGISDKYWLSSIITDHSYSYQATVKSEPTADNWQMFSTEITSKEPILIPTSTSKSIKHHLFVGAKEVKTLNQYKNQLDAKLFDRTIDFGWFYFLTKPFFFIIQLLYSLIGNFGLAILAMTVIIKALLFPMANKSFATIAKMRKIHPQIEEIKKQYKQDKIALNRELIELYKKQKVNPASGCLPILIQIPVFFALYKVLFVTIDMRHAPFYGWISDLSAPDPTSIFNLFGFLPLQPIWHIGAWPIIMGITMVIQQKFNPAVTDPIQAKIFKFMPWVLTIVLANFPAGLVIYWSWSNVLSIIQQSIINRKYRN
jgi:YidC/Oxa1 family membrane protein insertase